MPVAPAMMHAAQRRKRVVITIDPLEDEVRCEPRSRHRSENVTREMNVETGRAPGGLERAARRKSGHDPFMRIP
jgi:hypothetical protein